MLISQNLRATT